MTMWGKWGFQLPPDRLTLSATWTSILSPVPSSIHATLIDPNWRRAMKEEFAALIATTPGTLSLARWLQCHHQQMGFQR
jgi:hypothetical protein